MGCAALVRVFGDAGFIGDGFRDQAEENEVSFETLFSKETTLEMQGVLLPWAFTNLCLIYMNVLP